MMNKTLGYILAGIGLLIFLFSYQGIRALLGLAIPANSNDIYLTILGVILLFVGAYISLKSLREVKEVPIYRGKEIVGYRVLGKK